MIEFNERLKELRTAQNLSQTKLSELTGIPQNNISQWETGLRTPNAKFVIKLAAFFNVTTDYILGVSDEL